MDRRTTVACGLGLVAWLHGGASAVAGNAASPRVPPAFLGGACMEVLRPGDAPLHLRIGVPLEELQPTADEPPGTRSFQFFAVCREPFPDEDLPPWIDDADVAAALMANPDLVAPDPSLVLPHSPWFDCVVPVTGHEDRMPITCAGTAQGVTLAANALPAGNHVLYGYTYEPDKNLWTPRGGIVRVVGEAGEGALPPAVAFSYPASDAVVSTGLGATLTGCAVGKGGTTVVFSWATASDLIAFGDAAWTSFFELTLDGPDSTAFAVPFAPSAEALGHATNRVVKFRALAVDPDGAQWAAYTKQPTVLMPGCAAPQGGLEAVADLCGVGTQDAEPTDAGAQQAAVATCDADGDDESGTGMDTGGADSEGGAAPAGATTGTDPAASSGASSGASFGACAVAVPGRFAWGWWLALVVGGTWRRTRLARPARPRTRPSATRPR